MTKNKILLVFFALVFGFCGSSFADDYTDCEYNKSLCLAYLSSCTQEVRYISGIAANIVYESTLNGGVHGPSITVDAQEVNYKAVNLNSYLGSVRSLVESVVCSSNDTCSVDLSPILTVLNYINSRLQSIYSDVQLIRQTLNSLNSTVHDDLFRVLDNQSQIFGVLSNMQYTVDYDLTSISNVVGAIYSSQLVFYDDFSGFVSVFIDFVTSYTSFRSSVLAYLGDIFDYLQDYLPYLETINESLAYLATNNVVSLDSSVLSNFFSAVNFYQNSQYGDLEFHKKSWKGLGVTDQWSEYPFRYTQNISSANIAELLSGGFRSSLISLASLNNYWYWFFDKIKTNELNTAGITAGLASLSNIASRVDSYVLGDFSNKFNEVVGLMNVIVTNQLEQLTNSNISALSALVETNNIYTVSNNLYLSSIDSKLDVLDYIKILSDTPLADYSGDGDYFDYLTNLYINGSADSGFASTNWFERMEILLASLVFGDSGSTNDIPQGVEMDGVDSSTVETALSDFTYNQEFTGAITALDDTRQSFIGVLNGLHTSIKSVSLPASISIGLGGLDGEDTHNFEDMMHGHFQVSFNTGVADRFTIAVRAVTTISWVLLFFLALWKSGFYLIRKLVYLYRLVTRLLVSVFTR